MSEVKGSFTCSVDQRGRLRTHLIFSRNIQSLLVVDYFRIVVIFNGHLCYHYRHELLLFYEPCYMLNVIYIHVIDHRVLIYTFKEEILL